jgi:hypothetical protein
MLNEINRAMDHLPPPNGDWYTQTCHSIECIASELCVSALIEQTPSAKSPANDDLVAKDCSLNRAPSIVTQSTLLAYSTMLRNHHNMPVALTRCCLVHNSCRTWRNDYRSIWMAFGHSMVDCLTIVRTIGRQRMTCIMTHPRQAERRQQPT